MCTTGSDLSEKWKKKNLDHWKTDCDAKTILYKPTNREKLKYASMRLSGEKCDGCRRRRKAVLESTKIMRLKLEQYF